MKKLDERVIVTGIPPEMLTKEVRVITTAATADLTPTSGKKIRVLGFSIANTITSTLTATLRASLSFGTDHVTDTTKVLYSFRRDEVGDLTLPIVNINVLGEVDEVVRLTNTTFSAGGCLARSVIYYREE
jgi:hypothetical protein